MTGSLPDNVEVKRIASGAWQCRVYLGKDVVSGKVLRPSRCFPATLTRKEAEEAAAQWLVSMDPAGAYGVAMRLDEVLLLYLKDLQVQGRSESTIETYKSRIRCHIPPAMGKMLPANVRPYMISLLYAQMLDPVPPKRPVGRNTVRNMHGFLSGAFKWMRREGFIVANPMVDIMPPEKEIHEAVPVTGEDMERLAEALEDAMEDDSIEYANILNRNCAFGAYTSLWSGMREGEVCALARGDARRKAGFLHVHANATGQGRKLQRCLKTKGKRSRNVSMPSSYFDCLDAHYEWQARYLDGSVQGSELMVLTMPDGSMIAPARLSRWFSKLRDELHIPKGVKFHSLRHTHSSVLLSEGVDLKTISERLGHAKETTTLAIYSHVMPGRDQAAAEVFSAFAGELRGGGP